MITVWIDEFTPCLRDSTTGEIVETEVVRLRRKSFLSKYNKKTGWYTDWSKMLDENEVYALVVKGSMDIQGLVALSPKKDYGGVYIAWMCTSPENNKQICDCPKYLGIGGHLFAIAAQKSCEYGFEGAMTGYAANSKLLAHYETVFNAEHIPFLHPYQFIIGEKDASKIMEVYDYEWTDDEL